MTSPPVSLIGAARPRVERRPSTVTDSLGIEAVELAALAGLPLEGWQADGLELMLSTRADGKWACREFGEIVGRQQGKSVGLGAPRALAGLLLLGERLIMWSAHEYKTAIEAFLAVKHALDTLGEPAGPNLIALDDGRITVKVNNTNGEEGFELRQPGVSPQRLRFIARSKGSGRGFSGDCNLVDEAFAYTRTQQSALAPTMLARPNPQTVYLSSPPLDGMSGEVLFALKSRAEAGDDRLGWRDWGLPKHLDDVHRMLPAERDAFLDDRSNWAATLPALGHGRVSEESIDQLRRELGDADFAREVLGCWPVQVGADGAWRVIGEQPWRSLADTDSQVTDPVVFAVDGTPDRSAAAVGAAGRRADGVGHVEIVDARPGMGWLLERITDLYRTHRPTGLLLDPASSAGSLIPELQRNGIEPDLVTGREMAQACGAFHQDVVETGAFRHRDQPALNKAVAEATKRKLADAWAWDKRTTDADISPLVAATLAWHGVAKHGNPAKSAYDAEDATLMVV